MRKTTQNALSDLADFIFHYEGTTFSSSGSGVMYEEAVALADALASKAITTLMGYLRIDALRIQNELDGLRKSRARKSRGAK